MGTQNQKANLERLALVKRLLNENKEVVPYERVLTSAASKRVSQAVINMLTERYGTEKAVYCPVLQDDKIAYTDGRKIVVNIGCDYFKRCKTLETLEKRRMVEQGLYTHEAGHVLFTDFKTFQDLLNEWESEKKITFPVKQFPYFSQTAFAEINDCFAKNQKLIETIFFDIQNIMEDAYIEERILQTYKGSVNTSLLYVRNFLISDLKKRYKESKDLCWHDALLSQARGCLPEDYLKQNHVFEKTARLFDANAKGFCSFFDRIGRSFSAMFLLWDKYIKPKVDEALLQEEMLRELLKNLPQDELKKMMENEQQNGIASSSFPIPMPMPSPNSDSSDTGESNNGNNSQSDETSQGQKSSSSETSDSGTDGEQSDDSASSASDGPSKPDESDGVQSDDSIDCSSDGSSDTDENDGEQSDNSFGGDSNGPSDADDTDGEQSDDSFGGDSEGSSDTDENNDEQSSGSSGAPSDTDESDGEQSDDTTGNDSDGSLDTDESAGEQLDDSTGCDSDGSSGTDENGDEQSDDSTSGGSDGRSDTDENDGEQSDDRKIDNKGDCDNGENSENADSAGESDDAQASDSDLADSTDSSGNTSSSTSEVNMPDFIPSTAETKDLDSIPDGEVNEFNEDEYFDSLNPPTTLDGNKEPTDIGDTFSKNDEKSILSQTLNELSTTNEGLIERIADEIETFEISQTSLHKKVNCDIIHVRSGDENEYRRLALEAGVAKLSKALQKMVNAELFERRKGSVKRNLYSGKNLDLKSLANGSNKVFMQNKLPNKKPLISASILIDQSGSMSGEKIRHSIITAMVLEDFCRNLKIPFSITGHDVGCEGVRIFDYIDFGERNLSARNRLMRIQAGGCNRDGYAIRYVLNKMARRNESTKLLFLLSDGLPNDGGYGSASLIADLKEMQPIFRANRVILVPLCIDKNSLKSLRNIYGASLVDATNLQKLPYTLNQLLVKEIKKIL